MTRKSCFQIIAALLIIAVCIAMATAFLVPRMLNLDSYKPQILALMEKSVNRQVSYESASFSRQLIPSFVLTGITIKDKTGGTNLLTVDQLTFRLALLPLLHNKVRLKGIILERPLLNLDRDQTGIFSISDLFTGPPSTYDVHINDIQVKNGRIRFSDRMSARQELTTSLENIDLQIHSLTRGKTTEFTFTTMIREQGGHAELSVSGTAGIPAQGYPLRETRLNVVLSARNLDTGHYWPYYGRFLPFERLQGTFDIEKCLFKGKLRAFTTQGHLRLRDLQLDYPQVFHAKLTPKTIDLSYDLELTAQKLSAKSIDLKVDGLALKGSLALSDIHGKDPHLSVQASSSPFRLEELRSYIPYGVIPRGTADFIERHIKGGTFRVDEGRVDGRISQILNMGYGTNYNALFIRAAVDKGVMTFGPQVPMISTIKGGLEFRGKDFILRGMTGNFGGSPFSIEGKIADYPLDKPASYPFSMSITPAQTEVAWLLRQGKPGQMTFSGPSELRLSGSGIARDYRLSGSWDLSRADYQFSSRVRKPAGLTNRIMFGATLGTAEARLTELRYELPHLDATASAVYRYDEPLPLSCSVATNHFDVRDLLPVIPGLAPYQPAGKLQAAFSATGNPAAPDNLDWKGAVTLAGFSLRPFERVSPLKHINGTLNLSGTILETKQLTGQLGNSNVTVKGSVSGFSNPAVEMTLASPALHLNDLGFQSPGQDLQLKGFATSVSLMAGRLNIASLAGQVNSSSFSVQGTVPDINNPEITLRAHFPFLRVEDLLLFSGLKPAGGNTGKPGGIPLILRATAEAGSLGEILFAKLDTGVFWRNNQLAVKALSAGAFGGTVSGSGTAETATAGGSLYRAQYRLERVDAAQLSTAAGIEAKVTGQLTADGVLTAQGSSPAELKKSAFGTVRLHMQDGVAHNPRASGEKIPYTILDADLSFNKGVFTVQGLRAGVFGGNISGSGTADTASAGGSLYQAQYRLERVDAARLSTAAGIEQKVTGQLTANGDLTLQGSSLDGLRKTARVSVDIELHNGSLGISMAAEKRNVQEVPFKKIKGHLSYEKNELTVSSAQIDVFDGVATGVGAANFTFLHKPGYQVRFTSKSIDAAQLDQAFGFKSDITGRLALRGELTAKGEGQDALKKSLQGTLGMRLENGVINKFTTISKIFSILNVSQLFSWRLPDMVSTGMPYTLIDGNFSLTGGIASTSDLSIKSPSINMKIVGKADIVKKEIDLTAAVQPLQTIGMIVSRIPVIGWILTGGDRSLLVTYYQAKGNWDDPTVSSANISELPQSVFNVFKRTFSLPEKLITDTNKVLLGN